MLTSALVDVGAKTRTADASDALRRVALPGALEVPQVAGLLSSAAVVRSALRCLCSGLGFDVLKQSKREKYTFFGGSFLQNHVWQFL